MGVSQLAYVGINITDVAAWRHLATDILGMEERKRKGGGPLYYRVDDHHHRFALHPGKTDGVAYMGWETSTRGDFDETVESVKRAGLKVTPGTKKEKDLRKVLELAKFTDPGGFPMEICYGPLHDEDPFRPGRAISGFHADLLGAGHVVLCYGDYKPSYEFYTKYMGFRLSDYIQFPETEVAFLHCNPRHHSLALFNEGLGSKPGTLNHFSLQMNSIDDVGRAYDLCKEHDVPLALSIGRHTNDEMISFYLISPSGFAIEVGYGGLEVDDETWEEKNYTAAAYWGHSPEAGLTGGGPKKSSGKRARGQLKA